MRTAPSMRLPIVEDIERARTALDRLPPPPVLPPPAPAVDTNANVLAAVSWALLRRGVAARRGRRARARRSAA